MHSHGNSRVQEFKKRFYIIADDVRKDPRTKAYQDIMAEAGERTILKSKEVEDVYAMRDAVFADENFQRIVNDTGVIEASFLFNLNNMKMKARPDYVSFDDDVVIDLKITASYLLISLCRKGRA